MLGLEASGKMETYNELPDGLVLHGNAGFESTVNLVTSTTCGGNEANDLYGCISIDVAVRLDGGVVYRDLHWSGIDVAGTGFIMAWGLELGHSTREDKDVLIIEDD